MTRSRTRQRRTRQRRTKPRRTKQRTKQWTKQRTKPLRNNQRVKQRKTRRRTRGGSGGQPERPKTRSQAVQRRASAAAFHLAQAVELEAKRKERAKAAASSAYSDVDRVPYQPTRCEQGCQTNHKFQRKGCCGQRRHVIYYDERGNHNPHGWLTDFDTKADYDAHQETRLAREAAMHRRRSDSPDLSPLQQPDLTRMGPAPEQRSPPGSPLRSTTPQKHPPRASHPGTAGTRSPPRRARTPPLPRRGTPPPRR